MNWDFMGRRLRDVMALDEVWPRDKRSKMWVRERRSVGSSAGVVYRRARLLLGAAYNRRSRAHDCHNPRPIVRRISMR